MPYLHLLFHCFSDMIFLLKWLIDLASLWFISISRILFLELCLYFIYFPLVHEIFVNNFGEEYLHNHDRSDVGLKILALIPVDIYCGWTYFLHFRASLLQAAFAVFRRGWQNKRACTLHLEENCKRWVSFG